MGRKGAITAVLIALVCLGVTAPASASAAMIANSDLPSLNVVTPADPVAQTQFGWSLAASGDTMIAGRYRGDTSNKEALYFFERTAEGWTQRQKIALTQDPGDVVLQGDTFAVNLENSTQVWTRVGGVWQRQQVIPYLDDSPGSLALDGDTLVIGLHVYTRTGDTWALQTTLVPSGGSGRASSAIKGDVLVVGMFEENAPLRASGAVYVFERSAGVWTQSARLVRTDAVAWDGLGNSIAFDGTQIAARVFGWQSQTGAICVWERDGSGWKFVQQITSPDGRPGNIVDYGGDSFGSGVAIDDDVMVAGAPEDDDQGSNSGSVYVMRRVDDRWVHYRKITAGDGEAGDYFGDNLAVANDRVLVCRRLDDSPLDDAGSVYAFDLGFATPTDTTLTVDAPAVLVNDALPSWNLLTVFAAAQPTHGAVDMDSDASFTYTPTAGWKGTDGFRYACTDGVDTSNDATVAIQTWEPTTLSLAPSTFTPSYGGSAMLKATLKTLSGAPVAGRTVALEYLSGTKWVSVTSKATNSSGTVSVKVSSLKTARRYRARTGFSAIYGASGSQIRVAPRVVLPKPSAPSSVRHGSNFSVSGYLKPRHKSGSKPVKLYFYRSEAGLWVQKLLVSTSVKNYSSYSKYAKTVKLSAKGAWKVRAYHHADSAHAETWSSTEYFKVK